MKKTTQYTLLLILLCQLPVGAQELLWKVDFLGFFDNREYSAPYQMSQTFSGVRVTPEIGLGLYNNKQRLMLGCSYIQPAGGQYKNASVLPVIYYNYNTPKHKMSMGNFPRTQLKESLPSFMLYDSLSYFRPNITGVLYQYIGRDGYLEAYLDWRTMRSKTDREAFLATIIGKYHYSFMAAGGRFMLNHLARTWGAADTFSVMDDIIFNPYIEANLTRFVPVLDSLSLSAGGIFSLERHRGIGTWHKPAGFISNIYIKYRRLSLRNIIYAGKNQMPLYPIHGSDLNQGDPFYRANFYTRLDMTYQFIKTKNINCYFSYNLHYAKGGKLDHQQQLILTYYFNNK